MGVRCNDLSSSSDLAIFALSSLIFHALTLEPFLR